MKLRYIARVNDEGTLMVQGKARMQKELRETLEGKWVVLTIEKKRKKRTSQQNRYYWGVLIPVARDAFVDAGNWGVTEQEVHEFFKDRFLKNGKEMMMPDGELIKMKPTTTTLTVGEEMEYMEEIIKFLAEYFNVVVPDPETQSELGWA